MKSKLSDTFSQLRNQTGSFFELKKSPDGSKGSFSMPEKSPDKSKGCFSVPEKSPDGSKGCFSISEKSPNGSKRCFFMLEKCPNGSKGSLSVLEKCPDDFKKRPYSLHLCKYKGKTADFTKKEPGNVVSYQFYTPLMRHQARHLWQQKTGYRQQEQNNWQWQKNGTAI